MTVYYVDADSASEAAPYDTQAKGAHTLATILAIPPSAGDIIYCCAGASVGETIASGLAMSSSGTNTGGWIKIIGCNASGTVDGTRYIIDANNGDFDIIDFAGYDMWWLENIEVKNNGGSSQHGFYSSAASSLGLVFINCCANDCTGSGFYPQNFTAAKVFRCVSYSNTGHGFAFGASSSIFLCCVARDNSDSGFQSPGVIFINCVSHGNTDDGFESASLGAIIINCVVDGNGDDGISFAADTALYGALIFACRITNHSGAGDIGLNANSEPVITGFCYFEDNDGNNIQNDTLHQFIPLEGTATTSNLEDLANTDEGYVDKTNHDFSTGYTDSGNPDLRRTAITLPWS